jgi:hypothetical protein
VRHPNRGQDGVKKIDLASPIRAEPSSVDNYTGLVQDAVRASDGPQVDSDPVPDPRLLRGLFEMKNCGCFFMCIVSLVSKRPSHPTYRTNLSILTSLWPPEHQTAEVTDDSVE